MSVNDYIGTILAIILALLMVVAYVYAFSSKNTEKFAKSRHIPLEEDNAD